MDTEAHPTDGWIAPIGGMRELLACVPAVSAAAVEQWTTRGFVAFSQPRRGRGVAMPKTGLDVLQVATIAELARLGMPLGACACAWLIVRERVLGVAGHVGIVLFADPHDNAVMAQPYGDAGPTPVLAEWGDPGAIVLFRIPPFVRRVAERINIVAKQETSR